MSRNVSLVARPEFPIRAAAGVSLSASAAPASVARRASNHWRIIRSGSVNPSSAFFKGVAASHDKSIATVALKIAFYLKHTAYVKCAIELPHQLDVLFPGLVRVLTFIGAAAPLPQEDGKSSAERPEIAEATISPCSKPPVLIVDDEPDICELLSITLERMSLAPRTANTIAAAQRLLKSRALRSCASPTCDCPTGTAWIW